MSQGKRAKVRAATRHRESEAREIAASQLDERIACGMCQGLDGRARRFAGENGDPCTICEGTGSGRRALALALLSDPSQGFDVLLAREHAEQLIAEATVRADKHYAAGNVQAAEHQGGRIRLGLRILAALDGQPSECTNCDGRGETGPGWPCTPGATVTVAATVAVRVIGEDGKPRQTRVGEQLLARCSECEGTGHNPRGVLPAVEVSAQVRRRRDDGRRRELVARGLAFRATGTMADILSIPGVTGAQEEPEATLRVQARAHSTNEQRATAVALADVVLAGVRVIIETTWDTPRIAGLDAAVFTIE